MKQTIQDPNYAKAVRIHFSDGRGIVEYPSVIEAAIGMDMLPRDGSDYLIQLLKAEKPLPSHVEWIEYMDSETEELYREDRQERKDYICRNVLIRAVSPTGETLEFPGAGVAARDPRVPDTYHVIKSLLCGSSKRTRSGWVYSRVGNEPIGRMKPLTYYIPMWPSTPKPRHINAEASYPDDFVGPRPEYYTLPDAFRARIVANPDYYPAEIVERYETQMRWDRKEGDLTTRCNRCASLRIWKDETPYAIDRKWKRYCVECSGPIVRKDPLAGIIFGDMM